MTSDAPDMMPTITKPTRGYCLLRLPDGQIVTWRKEHVYPDKVCACGGFRGLTKGEEARHERSKRHLRYAATRVLG